MAQLGTIILAWIQKEMCLFLNLLPGYLDFYRLRDRIPFFTLLFYLAPIVTKRKQVWEFLSMYFVTVTGMIGVVSVCFDITGIANTTLTGFTWRYSAPIQYSIQIILVTYLAYRATGDLTYSTALGFHASSATGYIYETPFWIFSIKETAHFLHSNPGNLFFISYQIISIPVFVWLLSRKGVKIEKEKITYFIYTYFITYAMASKLYLLESAGYSRIPFIMYSVYLVSKLEKILNN